MLFADRISSLSKLPLIFLQLLVSKMSREAAHYQSRFPPPYLFPFVRLKAKHFINAAAFLGAKCFLLNNAVGGRGEPRNHYSKQPGSKVLPQLHTKWSGAEKTFLLILNASVIQRVFASTKGREWAEVHAGDFTHWLVNAVQVGLLPLTSASW